MIRITTPATSANLGSGFDSLGVALSIHNVVLMEECDHIDITCKTGHQIANDETNLIYKCAKRVYDVCGVPLKGLKIVEECNIPMTRGLGSSSACTVAGLLGANALLKNPLSRQEIIDLAARIEGHPDNSTPAILGGFVAALLNDGHVWHVRVPIGEKLSFAAFIPNFELSTEKARNALPQKVPHQDAVFNVGRAALLAGSLVTGDFHNIGVAVDDRLHQPYRYDLIPHGRDVMEAVRTVGALGTYISGAGPTIIALVDSADEGFYNRVTRYFKDRFDNWSIHMMSCDETGAKVEVMA